MRQHTRTRPGRTQLYYAFGKTRIIKRTTVFPLKTITPPGEKYYSYNEVKKLRIIVLQKSHTPKQGLLFVARNTSFVAGFLTHVSIWSYDDAQQTLKKSFLRLASQNKESIRSFPLPRTALKGFSSKLIISGVRRKPDWRTSIRDRGVSTGKGRRVSVCCKVRDTKKV